MAEIIFNNGFPELAQARVAEILNEFSWLFPAWLQKIYVGYNADEKDSSAFINIEKDYRFALLTICGHWLAEKPETQREQIVHELIHLFFSPLKNYALDVIGELADGGEKGAIYKIVKRELISKNEQMTQDFAFAIANKFQ